MTGTAFPMARAIGRSFGAVDRGRLSDLVTCGVAARSAVGKFFIKLKSSAMPMSRPTGSDHSARRALSVRSKLFDWCRAGHLSRVDRRRRQRRRGSAIAKRYVSKMVGLTPEPGRGMGVVNGDQKVAKSGEIARLCQNRQIHVFWKSSKKVEKTGKKCEKSDFLGAQKSAKKCTFWPPGGPGLG